MRISSPAKSIRFSYDFRPVRFLFCCIVLALTSCQSSESVPTARPAEARTAAPIQIQPIETLLPENPMPTTATVKASLEPSPTLAAPVATKTALGPTPIPEHIVDAYGHAMNLVSGGEFVMGRAGFRADEGPEHIVDLSDYYLDVFEVTNQQFAAFLNDIGNQIEGGVSWLDNLAIEVRIHFVGGLWVADSSYADHPAVEMTWYGANAYCQWRGLDLPTEAQWEKAARADTDRMFPWGNAISCDLAQYGECGGQTVPVGSFPCGISPYGINDLAGNAWEWTRDWYGPDYYTMSPDADPLGPEAGSFKVTRGGAWFYVADHQRTTFRNHARPRVSYSYVGFRCALTP